MRGECDRSLRCVSGKCSSPEGSCLPPGYILCTSEVSSAMAKRPGVGVFVLQDDRRRKGDLGRFRPRHETCHGPELALAAANPACS